MIKLREAQYCNLKLFLIFLVIYGHLIEPQIHSSKLLLVQYRWIYLFHMPLFCFLSGLFLKDSNTCKKQWKKNLLFYLSIQGALVLFGNGKYSLLTPHWYLWYLLSYSTWAALGQLLLHFGKERKFPLIPVLVGIGCCAGFIDAIGRELSLSRTLVFLPYFCLGLLWDQNYPWKTLRLPALVGLGAVMVLMALWGDRIPPEFLYQAEPYTDPVRDFALRLLCYAMGFLLCMFFLAYAPRKRYFFSAWAADTMPVYLLHGPMVLFIRSLGFPWYVLLLLSGAIICLIHIILKWHSRLYGIISTERGNIGDSLPKGL